MFPVVFDDGSHKEICSRNEILSPQSDGSASKPPRSGGVFFDAGAATKQQGRRVG